MWIFRGVAMLFVLPDSTAFLKKKKAFFSAEKNPSLIFQVA